MIECMQIEVMMMMICYDLKINIYQPSQIKIKVYTQTTTEYSVTIQQLMLIIKWCSVLR